MWLVIVVCTFFYSEARRRQRLYKKRKYLDRMGVKSKSKAKLLFTPDQIELMKFLHRDKPDVHTISSLAVSFDVHPEVCS